MNLTLRRKIIGLVILAAILPVLVMFFLTVDFQGIITDSAEAELDSLAMMNIAQIARDIYGLCKTSNDLIQNKINYDLKVARDILDRQGRVSLGSETVMWEAGNQYTKQSESVKLPLFLVGGKWLGINDDLKVRTLVVDKVKELVGGTCTIFQRMNDHGDMLRVATNVEGLDHKRAIGTYIPSITPDGTFQPVIESVLRGQTYRGLNYVVNAWYLTAYEPLKDRSGKIIGMLYVGEKLESVESLRQTILKTEVGKTGYMWVLHGKGSNKGSYIISKDSERDGENIWNTKDSSGNYFIQSIIEKALKLNNDEVAYLKYTWKNPGETVERNKTSAFTYFEPWDWVIGAGVYDDDYYQAKNKLEELTGDLLIKLILYGIVVMFLAIAPAYLIVNRMTRPLSLITCLAKKIAAGDVEDAKNDLKAVDIQYHEKTSGKYFVHNVDEITELFEAFNTMTNNLDSLIGQVQRSGIQVTTTATEISASVRQLQATVAEQASSSKEVTATSKEISSTSVDLAYTMDDVSKSVADTASIADTGRTNLNNMESVMHRLIKATGTISSKLAVISKKTNNISSVGTTINKISDQTHLLSLNAAIEAEKAGEYGKGFSVVAREISRLADQTAIATQDIEYMVKEMQSSVSSGVMEMDRFNEEIKQGVGEISAIGGQLGGIIDQVRALGPQFETVKEGMHTQEQGAQQISDAISQLSETAEQTKESLQEFKLAIDQLNTAVQGLQSEVSHFKISSYAV